MTCIYSPFWVFGIIINYTESLPLGLYRKIAEVPVRGSYVLFKLTNPEYRPYAQGQLIKRVAGIRGDHIRINCDEIWINGEAVKDSKQCLIDRNGSPLPTLVLDHVLADDELLCLGENVRSFDSRYFGIVKKDQIITALSPVFTFKK